MYPSIFYSRELNFLISNEVGSEIANKVGGGRRFNFCIW